ncbi:MAG TPA: methyltransferase domain-containing protein [Xanthobacteraceae bacterium]|nr:methyltransferase domain-containing protein [Xanthobacteraceae bacterium]
MTLGPLFLSSGDPALDRRLQWARALLDEGNAADAASLLDEAVERAPGLLAAWFLLGEAREAAGERNAAAQAYRRAQALDPADALGAALRLARLGAGPLRPMSEAYVRTLFDQYAGRFDGALARLGYNGPELLHAALQSACAALGRDCRFRHGLDLGCGTGLAGVQLAGTVDAFIGVDIAPAMVARAQARGLYRSVEAGGLLGFLERQPAAGADLVIAADVFCYLDDLAPVLNEAGRVLAPGGLAAFTTETHDGEGVRLRDTLRFAHGAAYVRTALAAGGLAPVVFEPGSIRRDRHEPVPGLVVVALRPPRESRDTEA